MPTARDLIFKAGLVRPENRRTFGTVPHEPGRRIGDMTEKELNDRGYFTVGPCCRSEPRKRCSECSNFSEGVNCAFELLGKSAGKSCGRPVCAKHAIKQVSGKYYCRAHGDFAKRKEGRS